MRIAILAIGDELLNGDQVDTNTTAIARLLAENGYQIRESIAVGDSIDNIVAALQRLVQEYEIILVTGGLGPTEDDRTAQAAAKAFGRTLSLNDEALVQIRERFAAWGRPMHPRNEKQARLPARSHVLLNRRGTAPGFRLVVNNQATLFFFPGVPSEMLSMLAEHALPWLHKNDPDPTPFVRRRFTVYGLPEPEVETRLDKAELPAAVKVAFAVDLPFVHVKLQATGETADRLIDQAELKARQALGYAIVGFGDETLAAVTTRLLITCELSLALAESCTGGMIAQQITDQPGASAILERSAVTYANSAKQDWLGVSAEILEGVGAVSEECALAMAAGIKAAADSRIGLAVTGIAGPTGGTPEKPIGTVYIAMVTDTEQQVERFCFSGDRQQVRIRTTCTALDWLRRLALLELASTTEKMRPQ